MLYRQELWAGMDQLSFEETSVGELAQLILSDQIVEQHYNQAKMHWIGDPDPSYRRNGDHPWIERTHDGSRYVYSHSLFSGFSVARRSLLQVAKDPWHRDSNPLAYFVAEQDMVSGEVCEYKVLDSSVDGRRRLWLQTMDNRDLTNWPVGKHPAYHAEPRDQTRIEIDLSANYHADRAKFNFGLRQSYRFEDVVGLESMIRQIQAARLPKYAPEYDLVAA